MTPAEPTDVTTTDAWAALLAHHGEVGGMHLREIFDADPDRGRELVVDAAELHVDYAKQRVTRETLRLLLELARAVDVEGMRDAMFAGEHINTSEDRAVLHTALRLPREADLVVDGQDVVADVHEVLDAMTAFTERLRSGEWTGATGQRIATVVNIGIGGSDLGPVMVHQALRHYCDGPAVRFVSNVDPADLVATLADLDPASTLFVVASKTFGTLETLTNATAAKRWITDALGEDGTVARHFVAVSTNAEKVSAFGIDTDTMFGFWDWVGGRYSVDSAIGLSVMCAIGADAFGELLDGFHQLDTHFRTAPLAENAPVIMGLLGVWSASFAGADAKAVLPYSNDLSRFAAYLQQLTMESNGKSVRRDGSPVSTPTGEVYWGEPGTNGQHAFYQLLHQGTRLVPADFLGFAEPLEDLPTMDGAGSMHDLLMSNFFAQTKVLAFGKTLEEIIAEGTGSDPAAADVAPHKVMPGNRPTTSILAPRLTPSVVGQLVALYEHVVFVQGVVWGVDSFDQWGVELGKTQAQELTPVLVDEAAPAPQDDSSTDALVRWYRAARGRAV